MAERASAFLHWFGLPVYPGHEPDVYDTRSLTYSNAIGMYLNRYVCGAVVKHLVTYLPACLPTITNHMRYYTPCLPPSPPPTAIERGVLSLYIQI